MTYAEAIDWLFNLNRFGVKLGLENVRGLTEALGRPQDRFDSVLIGGTNGKGSTAAILHSILLAAGVKSALYTSPHLVRAEERIRIGDRDIAAEDLTAILGQLRALIEQLLAKGRLAAHPTFFEVATAAAFVAFARSGIEVAVLEVGLGGRLDATNVVSPVLSVITNIDFDHRDVLGETLTAIALEKAGILRPGVTGLLGDLSEEPLGAIRARAKEIGAPLVLAADGSRAGQPRSSGPLFPPEFSLATPVRDYPGLVLPLAGAHQVRNALVAIRAAELLDRPGRPIGAAAVAGGLARARWPGRLEWIDGRPSLLLDGAHNPAGCRILAEYLATLPRRPVLLFAAMRDKETEQMLETLLPRVAGAVFTRPPMERAAEPAALLELARRVRARMARAAPNGPGAATGQGGAAQPGEERPGLASPPSPAAPPTRPGLFAAPGAGSDSSPGLRPGIPAGEEEAADLLVAGTTRPLGLGPGAALVTPGTRGPSGAATGHTAPGASDSAGVPLPGAPREDYHVEEQAVPALAAARRLAGPDGVVLACGSLFLVGAIKSILEGGTFRPGETP